MTTGATRAARLLAVAVLTATAVIMPASATAVAPPPVDDTLLPKPGPARPPERTEQYAQCVTSSAGDHDITAADQSKGLDLTSVWKLSRGAGQTVAVIDTGVARHRLLPHLIPGGDYVSTGDGTTDCDGHGTVVAGIIGAATDSGDADAFRGIAPDATILAIRQSSTKFRPADEVTDSGVGDVNTLAAAVRAAADAGATVINVSTVACVATSDTLDDRALGAALAYAVDVKNVVVVAAAGNTGGAGQCPEQNLVDPADVHRPNWDAVQVVVSPGWYDDFVLTVGSVAADGAPSGFTLAGPWVDVAAPGEHVVSLDAGGERLIDSLPGFAGAGPISGTSYAAPVVTAVAALVRARWPQLTARQVMARIEDTAHRPPAGWDPFGGHGVIDALAALGGQPSAHPAPVAAAPSVSHTAQAADPRPRRIALSGAAICALAAAAMGFTASAVRLRRRDGVPHD